MESIFGLAEMPSLFCHFNLTQCPIASLTFVLVKPFRLQKIIKDLHILADANTVPR